MSGTPLDCVIVGGGPAGLTAALYLARFRREILLIDAGDSRAKWIPESHNQPAFPGGISGTEILQRMRQQAAHFGTQITAGLVTAVRRGADGNSFEIDHGDTTILARTVLLATGVVNHRPSMTDDFHQEALGRGLLRYCPVCDGFEAMFQDIAVIGADGHGVMEARFLRTYSDSVTLLPAEKVDLDDGDWWSLADAGITIVEHPATAFAIDADKIIVRAGGSDHRFDTVYPALGSTVNADLLRALGGDLSDQGCIMTDKHQMTSLAGIYAAGDVVEGLDQIAVASGQATIAATAIHNRLQESDARA